MTIVKWKKPSSNGLEKNQIDFYSPLSGMFGDFFSDSLFTKEYASYVPAVNILNDAKEYCIELSAPGFEKGDFNIELKNGTLYVSGQHQTQQENTEKNYTLKEFNYGSFKRSFSLSEEINESSIEAKYENGILRIQLPKKEEMNDEGRKIEIS